MNIAVAMPWRPRPGREYAYDISVAHWRRALPAAPVIDVDTGDEPFNSAACRNAGVRRAARSGADVVVIADADTLVEEGPLHNAIEGAAGSGLVHLPYTEYRSLDADGSAQHRAGAALSDCSALTVPGACSGVYVTTPATWWAHGGQDERFRGWGFEDAAWEAAHTTLLGAPPVRHEGRVYALHHPPGAKEGLQYEANAALCYRYHQAASDPGAMRALVEEREASCSPPRP
ncbi:hypothetical protein [Streptomyces cinnamoneus]|uniref:Galactosyltransferase C-terminal domain-containing protein n=1 Tax=Streptomyces cinnamoneus TaxID=53446 RepID=A0A918T8B4_STRCJ|nr:hypothetical protein [Streptomyces cinnamoneus]GHC32039.1 hypothetical protein GCM10010507_00220 [Streptomyces cinnamoneus]